jgi:hypothetical protein
VKNILCVSAAGFSSIVDSLSSFPSPVYPEPLIRILTDHGLEGMVKKLGIGFRILFDVTGMDQFKWFLDQETMFLKSISNHENR